MAALRSTATTLRIASRRYVQVDLGIGRRTIFQDHIDELAARVGRISEREQALPAPRLSAKFAALADQPEGERTLDLDLEDEAFVLQAIDEWMGEARKLPDDVLALRHALRRRGV